VQPVINRVSKDPIVEVNKWLSH